jgi:hypothetical protein
MEALENYLQRSGIGSLLYPTSGEHKKRAERKKEKPTNQLFSSHLSYVSFLKLLSYAFSTVSQSESRSDRAVKRAVNEDSLSAPAVRC